MTRNYDNQIKTNFSAIQVMVIILSFRKNFSFNPLFVLTLSRKYKYKKRPFPQIFSYDFCVEFQIQTY